MNSTGNKDVDAVLAQAKTCQEELVILTSRDYMDAAIIGNDRLMSLLRGDIHDKLDQLLDLMKKAAALARKSHGKS